jgi:P-type Cu+ transporter
MLTGESWPQHKGSTARVFAGTLVRTGGFTMQAEATGENTLLAKIVDNVRRAQSSKPPIAKLVDQITRYFVPTIIVIALLSAAIWWFIGPSPRTAYSLIIFTTVLIIACPCALGLATPMAVIAGISRAAQAGVLVRAADALQAANQIDTIIFDKIGTLTEGRPSVVSLALLPQWQQQSETWLTLVAALERNSTHPLANAITTYIPHHPLPNVVSWQEHLGKGLSGQIAGHDVHVGNLRLMKELDISLPPLLDLQQQTDTRSAIHVFIAIDKQPVGMFAIQDSLRPEAISVVAKLQQAGLKTLILTGDDSRIARDIAASVGIDSFIAEVLPQDKAQHIQVLQKQGRRVAMVGDGINDAPALACADLSIAMGSGSDIALSCADLILLTADLNSLPASLTIVKATLGNIKQNLYGAFFYNGLSIPIAAGILYPFTGLLLNPMLASAAMALSSLTVVLYANRLLRLKVK